MSEELEKEFDLDLGETLGADSRASLQLLRLYIPNKDRYGIEFGTQRQWVEEAAKLLTKIGGGVTIMPPVEGGWDDGQGNIIWENPVLVYTFIKDEQFVENISVLREFVHRMGYETNQGEVVVEFDAEFYRITRFDKPEVI